MSERKFNVSDLNEDLKNNFQNGAVEPDNKADQKTNDNIVADFDDQAVFEWDALEFEYHQKGHNWRWGLIAVSLVVAIIFGVMQNWMGMVLVMMSGILIYQYAYKEPRKLHYVVTKDGLVIDDKVYKYDQMISYWLTKEGALYINTKWWPPRLMLMVNNVDIAALDDFLKHYVKKEERAEIDTGDSFSNWLKF